MTHGKPCGCHMASHVSQCMAEACIRDTWQAMCVTHGMPCVNLHGTLEYYIRGVPIQVVGEQQASVRGSSKEKEEEGKREREREEKKRKGKKKIEEKMGGREEKERGK